MTYLRQAERQREVVTDGRSDAKGSAPIVVLDSERTAEHEDISPAARRPDGGMPGGGGAGKHRRGFGGPIALPSPPDARLLDSRR
jgi:hypothetical protein